MNPCQSDTTAYCVFFFATLIFVYFVGYLGRSEISGDKTNKQKTYWQGLVNHTRANSQGLPLKNGCGHLGFRAENMRVICVAAM